MKRIIDQKNEFGVTCEISTNTVLSRVKRGTIASSGRGGASSPLIHARHALVQICIQMGKIHHPLNCTEAIELMNTLIKGTCIQKALANFQRSVLLEMMSSNMEE